MQNRQVFSWMEKPAFVANYIVGAGVLYHCRCLCCTNQPTKMVSGFQGSSTLSLVIHSNILDLYLKYNLFLVKSMHTFKLCGDSYQFLNINFWVRPPLYPCWCPVGARGVLKAEPYLAIHSIDCLLQKVITQVSQFIQRLNLVCFAHNSRSPTGLTWLPPPYWPPFVNSQGYSWVLPPQPTLNVGAAET